MSEVPVKQVPEVLVNQVSEVPVKEVSKATKTLADKVPR